MTTTTTAKTSFFVGLCVVVSAATASPSFLESSRPDSDSARLFQELTSAEEALLRGRIHDAAKRYHLLESKCRQLDDDGYTSVAASDKGLVASLCAMVALASDSPDRLAARLQRIETDPPPTEEKLYSEGRLSLALGDYRRGLFALELLRRSRPKHPMMLFWLARGYQSQGNRAKADELYDELEKLGDWRSSFKRNPAAVDGWHSGVRFGFFAGAPETFGAAVVAFDDRAFDTARAVRASLTGSVRGSYAVRGSLVDEETLPPAPLYFDGQVTERFRRFHGLGIDSPGDDPMTYREGHFTLGAAASRNLLDFLSLGIGWRHRFELLREGAPAVAPLPSQVGGPEAWLQFDTRDSRVTAWAGALLRVEGFFPTKGLGSDVTFERIRAEAAHYFRPSAKTRLAVAAALERLVGDAPLSLYPDLGAMLSLPGVYSFRYRDKSAARVGAEAQYRVGSRITLGGYGTAGTVAPELSRILEETWKAGAGATLEWQVAPSSRGTSFRLEVGFFGGELVTQAIAGAAF